MTLGLSEGAMTMKTFRSKERQGDNRPVDIAAARNDQRRKANAMGILHFAYPAPSRSGG